MNNQAFKINLDCIEDVFKLRRLQAGSIIELYGTVYTARDAAHKRITEALSRSEKLPFELSGAVVYYTGPSPTKPNEVIGSCGPTSSTRMDDYTPKLLDEGMIAMIGKGKRSLAVISSIKANNAVYLCAVGGAAALLKAKITQCQVIAYQDLGTEAVHRLKLNGMPLIVGIDSTGRSILN